MDSARIAEAEGVPLRQPAILARFPWMSWGGKGRPREPLEAPGAILLPFGVTGQEPRPETCSPTRIFPISSRWIWFVPS
jgi:hypothetical protein